MLRVLTAGNPSPLTGPGTNSFLVGTGDVAVIDPGPDDPAHRAAILAAIGSASVRAILVTHPHLDHSAGARALARATGAPVLAYGGALDGRSPQMAALAARSGEAGPEQAGPDGRAPTAGGGRLDGSDWPAVAPPPAATGLGGGEGLDLTFVPDQRLRDGEVIAGADWALTAVWTPGHCGAHMAFMLDDALICGDLILGWSSTLISPPDGDLADYMRSLARVAGLRPRRLLPGHGAPIEAPAARIAELAAHRRARTAEILGALIDGPATAEQLARRIYAVPPALIPAAARNVLAHLLALHDLGALSCTPYPAADALFART